MLRLGLRVAALTLVLDQVAKWLFLYFAVLPHNGLADFLANFDRREVCPPTPRFDLAPIEIVDDLRLTMVCNRGVSFGMFSAETETGRIALIAFALLVVGLLLVWLARAKGRLLAWAIGLVVGGAIGNVVDRVSYGAVVDFIDAQIMGYPFWTFNLADTAISLGVVLLIFEALFTPEGASRKKATEKT